MFYWLMKILFWPLGRAYLGLKVVGKVPRRGPFILAANHCSWLDPAVLGSACARPVRFLISRRLYDRRAQTWFYRWMRTIPVRDSGEADHGAVRQALRALRRGQIVGIFPEGVGLDSGGRLRSPRPGAALIAALAEVPIVPAAIDGTHEAMPKGRLWPRPGRVVVTFGEPFMIGQGQSGGRRNRREGGAEEMMRRISTLMQRQERA